jgi:cell division protein FtsQ
MARKSERARKPRPVWPAVRLGLRLAGAGLLVVSALYGLNRAERFLASDAHFLLLSPEQDASALRLVGVNNASNAEILDVFAEDFGRSVYLLPMARRAEQLRRIKWIKSAAVGRVWPNRVYVEVREREPVAYIHDYSDGASRIALVDVEGEILPRPPRARFPVPVMTGASTNDSRAALQDQARRLSQVMKSVTDPDGRISEVDVSDRSNVRVTARTDHSAIVLQLGDQDFGRRYQSFVNHYAEILMRSPNATMLDLRLDDRITAEEGPQ